MVEMCPANYSVLLVEKLHVGDIFFVHASFPLELLQSQNAELEISKCSFKNLILVLGKNNKRVWESVCLSFSS